MMRKSRPKPPVLVARAVRFLLQRRIHFEKGTIGEVVHEDDDYEVFRRVVLEPAEGQPEKPGAILRVTFNFARFNISTNKRLSLIPIPFIIGQPGFRSKTWMIGRATGKFQGLYEWDTVESAERYWDSFPMQLMKRRSIPESLRYEIHRINES